MFIQNDQTRKLLTKFSSNGLTDDEMADLKEQLKEHSPSMLSIIISTAVQPNCDRICLHRCQKEWVTLIASTSPACSLLHPSPRMPSLIQSLMTEDVTQHYRRKFLSFFT